MNENSNHPSPNRTPMEEAITLLCSEEGFLRRRVGEVDGEFFIQEFIDYGPSPSNDLPMKTVTLPPDQWHWSPSSENMRKRDRSYIKAQRLFFKTKRNCAKAALRQLIILNKWKDPIQSIQEIRKEKAIQTVTSNLVSIENATEDQIIAHIHRENVAVAWYDILKHLPCQIYNRFHNDWRIDHLDVRVIARLECRHIKGRHLIYIYDQNNKRIETIPNNIGWLKAFTRSMPLEEAQRIGVEYYDEYGSGKLDAYDRVLRLVRKYTEQHGWHVESIGETFQKDPRRAVARVGKVVEIIEHYEE